MRFPITAKPQGSSETLGVSEKEALLVWTTTPWTLTSNVAAAVGPELTYVKVKAEDGWTYYLAKEAMKNTLIGKDNEIVAETEGLRMLGWEYSGPFDELPAVQDAFAEAKVTPTASSPGKRSAQKKGRASSTSPPAAARRTSN